MYLVEFNDGLAIEIPEEWLDIYNEYTDLA